MNNKKILLITLTVIVCLFTWLLSSIFTIYGVKIEKTYKEARYQIDNNSAIRIFAIPTQKNNSFFSAIVPFYFHLTEEGPYKIFVHLETTVRDYEEFEIYNANITQKGGNKINFDFAPIKNQDNTISSKPIPPIKYHKDLSSKKLISFEGDVTINFLFTVKPSGMKEYKVALPLVFLEKKTRYMFVFSQI